MPACCSWNDVCQYETNKVTRIQSMNYGTLKWFLHVIVFFYVSFALVTDKLYQRKEPVISSVHTKVKGVAEVKEIVENGVRKVVGGIFDTADYTFPLQGNSFFVMTNFLKTASHLRLDGARGFLFVADELMCGSATLGTVGIQTGRCVVYRGSQKTCEVSAWCPTEAVEEAPRPALLASAENFTVLIKNNIDFPGHKYNTRNILPGLNISCTFHKTQDPQCPIFRLGDIFRQTGDNFSDVAVQGGIMGIEIYWDCNLDRWFHHCRPRYSFRRLDDKNVNESLYPGYNFRYAKYYKENNVEKRTLIKVFGIRFDILVFGTGGKFALIQLIVYIGSSLSYFGLATVFIDFLINTYSSDCCRSCIYPCCSTYCKPNEYYYRKKYESVVEPKRTLKYVSFVDEPHILMVDMQLKGKSLQDAKGQEIPRPPLDFTDLSRLPVSFLDPFPSPGDAEELQLLHKEAAARPKESPGWCQCGRCLPSRLSESRRCLEELCCRRKPGACITTSLLFDKVVLSKPTLQFLLRYQEPLLALDEEATNSRLRRYAYRYYIAWRFGSQDLADFAILPSCCRWRIRKAFPKSGAQYGGFRSPY